MSITTDRLALLGIADVEYDTVTVPEWGGAEIRVRGISAAERENLLKGSVTVEGKVKKFDPPAMRVKIVALAVVDESGTRVFTDADVPALGKKSAAAIDRIADVALRLAGISDDEDDDSAGKDSPATSDAGSHSD